MVGVAPRAGLPGCDTLPTIRPFKPAEGPKDSLILRGNGLEKADAHWHKRQGDIEVGKVQIADKKFADAERTFHAVAQDTKGPEQLREEALFYEAECQRLQKRYRAAEDTYSELFKYHPTSQFTERADRGLFEIALHWLEPTRKQMEEYE